MVESNSKKSSPSPSVKLDSPVAFQFQFLLKAIDDAQSTVRFLDSKAAFGIALLSVMLARVIVEFPSYLQWGSKPLWEECFLILFSAAALSAAVIAFRTLFPTSNPASNVSLTPPHVPQFYLWELKPKAWLRLFSQSPAYSVLQPPQKEYFQIFNSSDPETLLYVLTAELLKVSYIRQIKTDRLKAFGLCLIVSTVAFLGLVISQAVYIQQHRPLPQYEAPDSSYDSRLFQVIQPVAQAFELNA
jgi:hypothetical protein